MLVGQKLDVAYFQDHVQGFAQAGLLEDVGGIELLRGERRNLASVAEARERADEVGIESVGVGWLCKQQDRLESAVEEEGKDRKRVKGLLCIDSPLSTGLKVED